MQTRAFRAPAILVALVLLIVVLPFVGSAQMTFNQAYQARFALGDIPTTTPVEPAGSWNLVQRMQVPHTAGNETVLVLHVPAGMTASPPTCSCGTLGSSSQGSDVTVRIGSGIASGTYSIDLPASVTAPADGSLSADLQLPTGAPTDGVVVLYVPDGHPHTAAVTSSQELSCTADHPGCTIVTYVGSSGRPLPSPFALRVEPAAATTSTPPAINPATADMTPWLYAAGAFVLGCIVWALLVQQGIVQKRTRRQTVAVAAHEEIAAKESAAVLEGKKRALMAALKEVEVAKMNSEMDTATYDAVKAEFKRQAVIVMRALETGEGKKVE